LQDNQGLEKQDTSRVMQRHCQIKAHTDLEAVCCWLDEYKDNERTYRSYEKESTRLLMWCAYNQKKTLSALSVEDFKDYFDFLSDPQPRTDWCCGYKGRRARRGEADWKPFAGPLSDSSKATAIAVVNSLITYLVDANYLNHNPIKIIRKKIKSNADYHERKFEIQERILEPDEWRAILESLEAMPENSSKEIDEKVRLRFIIYSLYFLGLRISELVSSSWRSFREHEGKWWFYVVGKGNKLGKIPVHETLMQVVCQYRKQIRLPTYPEIDEDIPILVSWRTGEPLSARYINVLLKKLALQAAQMFSDKPEKMAKLKKFSAHWLRHLSASMQDRAGIQFTHIRQNLRHSNDETTRLYVHALDKERHIDMNKLKL